MRRLLASLWFEDLLNPGSFASGWYQSVILRSRGPICGGVGPSGFFRFALFFLGVMGAVEAGGGGGAGGSRTGGAGTCSAGGGVGRAGAIIGGGILGMVAEDVSPL